MQRRIRRFIGACGLVITFTAAVESISGAAAAAAGGGAISAGSAATAGRAAPAAPAATAGTAAANTSGTAVGGTPGATGGTVGTGTAVGGTPGATGGTVGTGTTVGGTPGATAGAVGAATTTTINPATGLPTTTTPIPGQVQANGIIGNTVSTAVGGTTTAAVPYTSLPQNVQAALINQIPAGAQLGQITQETTPQGVITYHAQVMQNGILSDLTLNGSTIAGTAAQSINRLAGTASSATGVPAVTGSGAVVGTPFAFETLPTPVQSAFTAQAGGIMPTNITFVAGANGAGTFRGFANGRPIDVRVGPNGQILPGLPQIAANTTTTTTATNEVTIEDVPVAVREAIKKSMPFAEITRVRQGDSASGKIFDITLRNGTDTTRMQIAEDGTVIRENADNNLSIAGTTAVTTNEPPKLALNTLPVVVRETIETRAQPQAIRTLILTNFQGKTAYAVDYLDRDALRHRLFIGKDGVVINTQTNVLRITQPNKAMVVADLPSPARAVIEAQAPEGTVTRVDMGMRGTDPVYVVTYLKDGQTQQIVVSRDGQRFDDAVGAAATTESGQEKK
jgi:hypothetical protein